VFGRVGSRLRPFCHPGSPQGSSQRGTTRDSTLQPFKGGIVKVLNRAGRRSGRAGDPDGSATALNYE
jgi:hypothetical protein